MMIIIWTISKLNRSYSVQNIKFLPAIESKASKKPNSKESTTKSFSKTKSQKTKNFKSKSTNSSQNLPISTFSTSNRPNTPNSSKSNSIALINFANKIKTEWNNLTLNFKDLKLYAKPKILKKITWSSKLKRKIKSSNNKTKSIGSLLKPLLKVSLFSRAENPKTFKIFGLNGKISLKLSVKINGQLPN